MPRWAAAAAVLPLAASAPAIGAPGLPWPVLLGIGLAGPAAYALGQGARWWVLYRLGCRALERTDLGGVPATLSALTGLSAPQPAPRQRRRSPRHGEPPEG
jgi:hypothetical protein